MEKETIKNLLRENSKNLNEDAENSRIKATVTHGDESEDDKSKGDDKILQLLNNDIINHAAVVRKMTGEEWVGNSEATNRSKFRKKLKKLNNDDGSPYSFDEDEVGQIEKILMGLSSTINHTIGRQGK